ncbi:MAG TPA: glycerate kinase [Bryobacteraceae bacterium]|nr:glycerate kinase [Bryobacteraceae bacterium]
MDNRPQVSNLPHKMRNSLDKDARRILRSAIAAADAGLAVERCLRRNRRTLAGRYRNVYVVGAGKACAAMARPIERLLGKRITAGLINVKYGHAGRGLRRIEANECGHPVPDRNGEAGARCIAQMARDAVAEDLIVCLISGGASALLPLPAPPVTLEDTQETTRLLLACGANIHEMNCVRKHISQVQGGQLARLAYPAKVLTLILSDVVGDDLDVIGSGPTVPDRSTFAEARGVFEKYRIWGKVPANVRERLAGNAPETPKPGDKIFGKVWNAIAGSNRLAVDAAARQARALGYRTLVLSTFMEGETREVARVHAAIAKEIRASGRPVKPPACVISGGETTVTIRGRGLGGRNQEFALAAALDIAGMKETVILSAGTDGTDGPTDAAGAIADGATVSRAHAKSIDAGAFLANNDSYHFFEAVGGLIKTGPTGTNVADVRIMLVR